MRARAYLIKPTLYLKSTLMKGLHSKHQHYTKPHGQKHTISTFVEHLTFIGPYRIFGFQSEQEDLDLDLSPLKMYTNIPI